MSVSQTATALDTFIELSEFGVLANNTDDLDLLLDCACRTVSHALGTDMAKVLERAPEDESLLRVRAVYGFPADPEPKIYALKDGSAAGYALLSGKPVVSEDIKYETRFRLNEVEQRNGVQSMANVVIPGPPGKPDYGVLEVDHPRPRRYEKKDVYFLQSYASFIAAAISRMNARRELEESYRKLDDFAYIVSHDLKEPARAISNYTAFLLEDYRESLDEEGGKKLETLQKMSDRMTRLISDLLHYSRTGKEEAAMEKVDVGEAVREALGLLELRIKENNVSVKLAQDFPRVACSRIALTEIFRNLIENSIKYNDSARKSVEIGFLAGHERNPHGYVFFVRDNGIGIPEQFQKTVFDMFRRLHGREAYGGGTGSGLAIVRKLLDRHNGNIWLESREGQGSTFYFCLDCENALH